MNIPKIQSMKSKKNIFHELGCSDGTHDLQNNPIVEHVKMLKCYHSHM